MDDYGPAANLTHDEWDRLIGPVPTDLLPCCQVMTVMRSMCRLARDHGMSSYGAVPFLRHHQRLIDLHTVNSLALDKLVAHAEGMIAKQVSGSYEANGTQYVTSRNVSIVQFDPGYI